MVIVNVILRFIGNYLEMGMLLAGYTLVAIVLINTWPRIEKYCQKHQPEHPFARLCYFTIFGLIMLASCLSFYLVLDKVDVLPKTRDREDWRDYLLSRIFFETLVKRTLFPFFYIITAAAYFTATTDNPICVWIEEFLEKFRMPELLLKN